jgi:hypothetical protein
LRYETPEVVDYGTISEHTFDNPGAGDKSGITSYVTDTFGEFSHPAAS